MKIPFIKFLAKHSFDMSFVIGKQLVDCLENKYDYALNNDLLKIEIQNGKFILHVLNTSNFLKFINILEDEANKKNNLTDREDAASKNIHTHNVNVSHSFLLVRNFNELNNTKTIFIDKDKVLTEHNSKRICLVVENLEVFCKLETLSCRLNVQLNNVDIIYGSGKSVNNKLNTKFFSLYNTVLCFFDIDKSGFDMYFSLKNSLKDIHTRVENIFVSEIEKYFSVSNPLPSGFENIVDYKKKNNDLLFHMDEYVLDLMRKYETGIEQEMFLTSLGELNDR